MRPFLYFLGMLAYPLGIAMLMAEKRILRTLRSAGAIDDSTAVEYEPRTFLHTFRLNRLLGKGAVVRTPSNKFFLDRAGYALYRGKRRRRAIISTAVALLLVLFLLWYQENNSKPNEESRYTLVTRTTHE